ncbi:MAG TPA: hypothetical protein VM120_30010 [Bryobacteraceae bacterium]|nr:hypothetical protein [Bryobacteraceae bacterium]
MKTLWKRMIQDESGQDIVEYTLLLAFVALASAALFNTAGGSISGIWGVASTRLSNASAAAGS